MKIENFLLIYLTSKSQDCWLCYHLTIVNFTEALEIFSLYDLYLYVTIFKINPENHLFNITWLLNVLTKYLCENKLNKLKSEKNKILYIPKCFNTFIIQ